jgi:hypothetical protein
LCSELKRDKAEVVLSVEVDTEVSLFPLRCEVDCCCVLEGIRKETALRSSYYPRQLLEAYVKITKIRVFKIIKIYLKCLLCSECVLFTSRPMRHQAWIRLTIFICRFKRILGFFPQVVYVHNYSLSVTKDYIPVRYSLQSKRSLHTQAAPARPSINLVLSFVCL